ncbi:iron ABC transporter ATP-binding protein [Clostridium polyendosporum]|uniref:Iron ABC transporter ATP-binding protein n=1 Tax=Clostridium polyendosporum TaxID=69208 RepID=A0A919VL27_9CLOT|nr:ABC transporter ATP-binding protein [Clostridium polyendosporum]GIM28173.1 iron ABC transporter ATP-binding protein [Clostridium polyendosporum]
MNFIDIENLQYQKGTNQILKGLTTSFNSGKFYSIVGPNGSGKTTFLKNIIKYLMPSQGKLKVEGMELGKIRAKDLASKINYVPQNTIMELDFTCFDMVMMGRSHKLKTFQKESKEDIEATFSAMELTDTLHLKDKFITEISGGERQRVILARAIAQDGKCIILDEPLSHLDINHQLSVLKHLNKLKNNGKTIITVLHDLNLALMYSEEIILMNNGKIFSSGRAKDVITPENIKQVYGVDSKVVTINGKKHILFI